MQLLTPSVLINRLINAHKHLLALRISEYLAMNQVSHLAFTLLHLILLLPSSWHSSPG